MVIKLTNLQDGSVILTEAEALAFTDSIYDFRIHDNGMYVAYYERDNNIKFGWIKQFKYRKLIKHLKSLLVKR